MAKTRILIIEARFYDHLADMLLAGAKAEIEAAGAEWLTITVPGILEIPGALSLILAAGRDYDGFVTLGCAIRGESDHYHHISAECIRSLNQIVVDNRLALGNGVLTVHNEEQALKRADPTRKNIGGQAARACLAMLALKRFLSP